MHGIGQQLCTRVTSSSCSHKFDAADTTGIQEKNVYSEMQNSRCGRESRMGYWAWGAAGAFEATEVLFSTTVSGVLHWSGTSITEEC